MDIDGIKNLISGYRAGKSPILENSLTVYYNPDLKRAKISPFYTYNDTIREGSCDELVASAYLNIRERFPSVYPIRSAIFLPNFYKDISTTHCILFVDSTNIMLNHDYMVDDDATNLTFSENALIVDPSSGFTELYSNFKHHWRDWYTEGRYIFEIKSLTNLNYPLEYSRAAFLDTASFFPIGETSNKEPIILIPKFADNSFSLDVNVVGPSYTYSISSCAFTDEKPVFDSNKLRNFMPENSNSFKFLQMLQNAEVIKTNDPLELKFDVVIK